MLMVIMMIISHPKNKTDLGEDQLQCAYVDVVDVVVDADDDADVDADVDADDGNYDDDKSPQEQGKSWSESVEVCVC